MKRLLRVSFDIFITSFTSIVTWFLIGLILDKNLTNVFSLTYPLQCVMGLIISIFGVGANVSIYKDKNKNAADNGIFYGILLSLIIYGLLFIFVNKYIYFMNMEPNVYNVFCCYSIIHIFLQIILHLILSKLYYLELNKKANLYSLLFNLINFIFLVITALISKNQFITSFVTLLALSIYILVILIKNINKIDFKLNIKNCIKYDASNFVYNIMFILIYLFGFSNSFAYGNKYVIAITFATIVTDVQWDICSSIKTVAKIDIVKDRFDYKYHLKNAIKLTFMLITSILILSLFIFPIYNPNIYIVSIFILLHILDFFIYTFYVIKLCYLEIEYSPLNVAINIFIAYFIRTLFIFMPTPYCTILGQMVASIYEFIYATIMYRKSVKIIYKNKSLCNN